MTTNEYVGLRLVGAHMQTRCCGREAITPIDSDQDSSYVSETDDGVPITKGNFPGADFVCPDCGRQWPPQGCSHESIKIKPGSIPVETESNSIWVTAECLECEELLDVALSIDDIRKIEDES